MGNADVQYRQMLARDDPCGSMPHGPAQNDGRITVKKILNYAGSHDHKPSTPRTQ